MLLAMGAPPQTDVDIRTTLDSGQYERAESIAWQRYDRVSSATAAASADLARAADLLVEAAVRNGHGSDPRLIEIAERAVRSKESVFGAEDIEVATSLALLGAVRYARGEFVSSLSASEHVVSVVQRQSDERSALYADGLDSLARSLIEVQQFDRAKGLLAESLAIREQMRDAMPVSVARSLEIAGRLQRELSHYQDSAAALDRALAIWSQSAASPTDAIEAMIARGEISFIQGDVKAASRMWSNASMLAQRLRPDHPTVARLNRFTALGEYGLGNVEAARWLTEEALRIGEISLAPCNPERFDELNDLANLRRDDGDYESAGTLYQRELSSIENCLTRSHRKAATVLYNLFALRAEMGASADAERLATQAIAIWTKSLGADHPFVAFGLSGYARFLSKAGRYNEARVAQQRAISIRRRIFGLHHPAVAELLADLAQTLSALGDSKKAAELANESIEILRVSPAWRPNALSVALGTRAKISRQMSDFESARNFYAEKLALSERVYGSDGAATASARIDLAVADIALNSGTEALTGALSGDEAGRKLLQFNMRSLPERRALELAAARPRGLDLALSIAAQRDRPSSVDASAVFDALIRSRGLILDELAARTRATSTTDEGSEALTRLRDARARYATLVARAATGGSVDAAALESAKSAKEDAEAAAAAESADTRSELARARLGLVDVQSSLPHDAALVAFARYERTTFHEQGDRQLIRHVPSYIAAVVRGQDNAIQFVPLGSAAAIDNAIEAWRSSVATANSGSQAGDAEREYRLAGARVRRLLWDPVARLIPDAARVFIVPDGAISTVSFAALPVGERSFLVEHTTVHYLSTERDLVPPENARSGEGILAVGGADYGSRDLSNLEGCAAALLRFEPLPATAAEAREIARLSDSAQTLVLTGSAASKTAILRAASGRRVVHLATHGFFFSGGCSVADAGRRGVGGLVRPSVRSKTVANPLMLSGLAVAGANRAGKAGDALAGLLTSEDVLSLNLEGTEWVVLSACDTGLGEIKSGEGVFGLRRAFQIAGAHTVIMSLWSVEDTATATWMRALYEARFRQHVSTADAVRAASLRVLSERRRRGESTHPFYWAGFVAAGDWR